MNIFGLVLALVVLGLAALVRAAGGSALRTVRADALRLAAEGRKGAASMARVLERPERIQPAVGAVHSALLVAAALPAAWATTVSAVGGELALDLVLLGLAVWVLGDLLPRVVGGRYPGSIAYRLAPLLATVVRVGATATDVSFEPEQGGEPGEEESEHEEETEMISSVLEFTDTVVREVMVPRTDMVTIAADASPDELLAAIVEHGFTRLPVIGEDVDDVVGVVIAKDLLPYLRRGSSPPRVREVMRPIDFVPETKKVAELLRQMQRSKTHLAVVVDEFGGTAGLVTIEDLLEELVGEIVDEYDEHDVLVSELGANAWRVDGRLPVTDLAEAVGVALPDDEWDTVGGLVLGLAGRLPEEAETFTFGPLEFSASQVQGRRVAEVVVRRRWDVEVSAERGGE